MDKIVLLPNAEKDASFALSLATMDVLKEFCSKIYTENENKELISAGAIGYARDAFPTDAQLLLVLGGDGTMLHAASVAVEHDIPILGVNIGRLGYLAAVEPSELDSLKKLATDTYDEQSRMMLSVTVRTKDGGERFLANALNDMVIDGGGRLCDLRLFERDGYLDYRADGLIVSTPTGSTAYSLSAGGPVVDETMDALGVTPVCPRSFFSRSLLFGADTTLRILNMSARADVRISIDGCTDAALSLGDEVIVRRAECRLRTILLTPRNLLEVLSTKMNTQHF
ncbi:MAG: NAD(+)/NADH kinase [Clostridia bacterium]|nr:NAD(+)/NADH kinase [Clostridia bacterium]